MHFTIVVVTSLYPLLDVKNINLPFDVYVPFDLNSEFRFWSFYFYLTYTSFVVICGTAAIEVLASILMQLICAQLEIMSNRLLELSQLEKNKKSIEDSSKQESAILKDCIHHHNHLYL